MADLWTAEDVERIKIKLRERFHGHQDVAVGHNWISPNCARCNETAEVVLAALAEAGRLREPGDETHIEWASEHAGHRCHGQPDPLILVTGEDRRLAELRVATWRRTHPHGKHRLLRREVTTTAIPWLPVDPEPAGEKP